jgi:hypothetical protein
LGLQRSGKLEKGKQWQEEAGGAHGDGFGLPNIKKAVKKRRTSLQGKPGEKFQAVKPSSIPDATDGNAFFVDSQ